MILPTLHHIASLVRLFHINWFMFIIIVLSLLALVDRMDKTLGFKSNYNNYNISMRSNPSHKAWPGDRY